MIKIKRRSLPWQIGDKVIINRECRGPVVCGDIGIIIGYAKNSNGKDIYNIEFDLAIGPYQDFFHPRLFTSYEEILRTL